MIVASVARQAPYGLDWPRDGAFFDYALDVVADTGSEEWAQRFLVGDRSLVGISERLAVGVRADRDPREG